MINILQYPNCNQPHLEYGPVASTPSRVQLPAAFATPGSAPADCRKRQQPSSFQLMINPTFVSLDSLQSSLELPPEVPTRLSLELLRTDPIQPARKLFKFQM